MKQTIVIHTKGNENIGIGNLSRCYELVLYLSKYFDVVGLFECSKELYERYKLKNIICSQEMNESICFLKKNKFDIYMCDLVDADKNLSDILRRIGIRKIFHLGGLEYGFEPDTLFVCDGFEYKLDVPNIAIYRGFEYYIIGENIIKNRPLYCRKITSIQNILICFGGADPALFTEYFAKNISDTIYNYTIVLGPAMSEKRKKDIQENKKCNIRYVKNPKNMMKLYSTHDMLVTLGGMMTYEAMCLGLPVCAVRWSYLEYIVKSFGEKNMIQDLGYIQDSYAKLLHLKIDDINKNTKNAFSIIDGSALENIKNAVIKEINTL